MVTVDVRSWLETGALLAEQASKPLLERLDPPRRAAVVMALLALVLTGLFFVACIMLGGHWVRRLARHKPRAQAANSTDSGGNRRLRESLQAILPEDKTDDTVQLDSPSKDTKVDT
jgi:hypothetical protein